MPIEYTNFKRPKWLLNGHWETVYPALFRKPKPLPFVRRELTLSDGDFIEVDYLQNGSSKVALLLHGFEGSSQAQYIQGAGNVLKDVGYDLVAINYRGCGGKANKLLRGYHIADTQDVTELINHIIESFDYKTMVMVGFSFGGSVTLKYLGENGNNVPSIIKAAFTASVSTDLRGMSNQLNKPKNYFYQQRFFRRMKQKMKQKEVLMKAAGYNVNDFNKHKTFNALDGWFTCPIYGFKNPEEYYEVGSPDNYIGEITIPTMLVNAKNDPFLSETCFPVDLANQNANFYLQIPQHGGHCGFTQQNNSTISYAEQMMIEFFDKQLKKI